MNVAVRVDAAVDLGAGHVMRCLSLADGLRARGASVTFIGRLPAHLRAMLNQRSYELVSIEAATAEGDARETAAALGRDRCDWLVVDHYRLDEAWESTLRRHAAHILVIDDLADRGHDCDVLLDQNLHANMEGRYLGRVPATCRQLLGPRYALLRDEFRRARARVSPRTAAVRRMLVSFGGVDAGNYTARAIDALASGTPTYAVDVVIGAAHPRGAEIEALCRRHGFACHTQPDDMAELMAAADMAVGAGGTTTWERCCLGLPALVVPVAPNQDAVAGAAARYGLVHAPAPPPTTAAAFAMHIRAFVESPALREMLSRNGLAAVDGCGVDRVVAAMDGEAVRVREATLDDSKALLEWRNHESVRCASRRSDPIERAAHQQWLHAVLADENRLLLIGERRGHPVGVVRFDIGAAGAEVSIHRVAGSGPGLGGALLRAAEAWLLARRPDVSRVNAEVLAGNDRSDRLFRSAGYRLRSTTYTKALGR